MPTGRDLTKALKRGPWPCERRAEKSASCCVRSAGERSAARGTQCVAAISVGCNFNSGLVGDVHKKMYGQITMRICFPHVVLIILSGRFPTEMHWSDVKSNPTSSCVSRTAAARSLSSSGSRRPPGSATCPDHLSPDRSMRLMKRTSGLPCRTQSWEKKDSSWLAPFGIVGVEADGS